jgi:signal transduction histidine kinase
LRIELSVGLAILVSLGILVSGLLLYQRQRHDLQEYLGMSLQNIARTGSLFLDGDAHREVARHRDKASLAYRRLRQVLDQIRAENGITTDVFTLEPVSDTVARLVVSTNDAVPPGRELRLAPETLPVLREVLREGTSLYSGLYAAGHGRRITAFAPIKDGQGDVVGALCVDYQADVFWRELRALRWRIAGFSLIGALVSVGAGLWYARRIARPLEGMAAQARAVAHGDFSRHLPVSGVREVVELSNTLNRMGAQLQSQRDALDRAHLERAHADRLASLGAVATELAHEMTQPLTAIQGISQGILEQTRGLPAETRDYLQVVVGEARRLRDLSQRLRAFSRRSRGDMHPGDVNAVIHSACLLLGPVARPRGIRIEQQLAPDLPEVVADHQALEQVALNLLTNALDAVEGRPDPCVTVATAPADSSGVSGIEIRVTDNGFGIPPEVLPHIFEPFFSTKESPQGTGLGLPISQDIVERHGGKLRAEDVRGSGACFRVWLPTCPSCLLERV